ncbi:hypothetical protein [Maribacter dokdonensis]|uniref:hypothetical protein n=1 Tax=Maribacter dokdonensis TaxID=320912 RepID=UPI000719900A|nr:hypothetical protein [Maribacter dokdonensis]KSA15227.1 Beta-helix fold protein [Maribacter dokdonensis DSW-8]
MKLLCLLTFLITGAVFGQNYHYALDSKKETDIDETEEFTGVQNFEEEILYFNSYLLPVSEADHLQEALITHGSVRLENGDYSGNPIIMTSGQRLFGHPTITKVPNITIQSGSSNVRIQNVDSYILFNSGAKISNSTFKNIRFTPLECTNCALEDNTFINLDRCRLNWDSRGSGYFRNNKFIKHWVHGEWPQVVMKGNDVTPSYGNVTVWSNLLTPGGHAIELENLSSQTYLGLDSESWNWNNESDKAMTFLRNMGDVKLVGLTGGNNIEYKSPVFDIQANNLDVFGKITTSNGGGFSIVRNNTNIVSLHDKSEGYIMENESTGFNFNGYSGNNVIQYNQTELNNNLSDTEKSSLTKFLLGTENDAWDNPSYETIPDILGPDWSNQRVSKTDQSDYIQNLIDSNGIAELEEGIYYIGKTLIIEDEEGIIGQGTGKTAIVGLSDDFPLVTGKGNSTAVNFVLSNLTLQGGSTGLRIHHIGDNFMQVTSCVFKFLVFRDQEIGIHLDKFYGFDNNFLDHLNFVNCGIGFFQEVDPNYVSGENYTMMYVDKIVFYKNQYVECDTAISMIAGRADNLNAWVNSKFDKNEIAADMKYHNGSFFANCDFTNHTGNYIIGGSPISLYSCRFNQNNAKTIFDIREIMIEGSSFLDDIDLFTSDASVKAFVRNSNVLGRLGRMDNGMLINSIISGDEGTQSLLINYSNRTPSIILDDISTPYPQFLVTH